MWHYKNIENFIVIVVRIIMIIEIISDIFIFMEINMKLFRWYARIILLTLYLIILLIFYWLHYLFDFIIHTSKKRILCNLTGRKQTINFLSRLCFLFGERPACKRKARWARWFKCKAIFPRKPYASVNARNRIN